MSGDRLRIGAIGAGYWGPNLIRNFVEIPDSEVVAVADLDAGRLNHISTRYPQISRMTSDYRELFDLDLDGVVISTPPQTHFEIARACMEAGLDVLIEKPLATSSEDARAMIKIADATDRILMVGHTFMYNAAVNALKDMIDGGELGELRYFDSVRVGLGLFHPSLNVVWDLGPHDISILMHLLGSAPHTVSARGVGCVQQSVEDIVYLTLTFPDNVLAHIRVSWLDPSKTRRVTAVGSKKMVIYDDVDSEKIRIYDKGVEAIPHTDTYGDFQFNYRYGDIVAPYIRFDEPLMVECTHFLNSIRTRERPLSDGFNGLQVVEVIEAAQLSLAEGGAAVAVEVTHEQPSGSDPEPVSPPIGSPRHLRSGVIGGATRTATVEGVTIDLVTDEPRVHAPGPTTVRMVPFAEPARPGETDRDNHEIAEIGPLVSRYIGTREAVGIPGDRSSLTVALSAMGIGAGDDVIAPANAPLATVRAIGASGARPVLVDVDPRTLTIDPDLAYSAMSPNTRAIVAVHLFGQPADMDELNDIGRSHGLRIIEEISEAVGARYRGDKVGALADAGVISFDDDSSTHGGFVVTNDFRLAAEMRGLVGPDPFESVALNGSAASFEGMYRALSDTGHPLQDLTVKKRRGVAALYDDLLSGLSVLTPPDVGFTRATYHHYVIRSPRRDALRSHLERAGIDTAIYEFPPPNLDPTHGDFGYQLGDFPVTEHCAQRLLSLPIYPSMTPEDVAYVAAAIRSFCEA